MAKRNVVSRSTLSLLGAIAAVAACTNPHSSNQTATDTNPTCTGGDCTSSGGSSGASSGGSSSGELDGGTTSSSSGDPGGIDGKKNGTETDVDCGGPNAPKCAVGKACLADTDCEIGCSYAHVCVSAPSCKTHIGGDTCGTGEVGSPGAAHEDCCRTLPVTGFSDAAHPGKKVYLDKYEITAGRVRQWIAEISRAAGGNPNVRDWIAKNRPAIWDDAWNNFLPTDAEGPIIVIARRLLGDPRPEDEDAGGPPGPGVILPPPTDQPRHLGTNYQFNSEVYADLHGGDCGVYDGSYGFPTYYYPPDILARDGQLPRADGTGLRGEKVMAKEFLDAKSMNCITNAMLAAFCAWDGGQLATDEVMDYVTATPASLGNVSGCGTQYDNHGELLSAIFDHTVQTGGRCAPVSLVNATFDAGDNLPTPGSSLNQHNYHYPDLGGATHDKSWEVSAPGRGSSAAGGMQTDQVRINPGDEPWVDLNGNLSESVLDVSGGSFTGYFGLKYRGIGYGSSRSDLNMTMIKGEDRLRIQRPEAKAAYIGGRCMRFK